MTEDEFNEEEETMSAQDVEDAQIMFFLRLMTNEYHTNDIQRIATKLNTMYHDQFKCKDCDISVLDKHEFFLVHDELEEEVDLDEGRLCVECFEKRLGRELQYFDFTGDMIINGGDDHSPLLKKRLISGLEETLPAE